MIYEKTAVVTGITGSDGSLLVEQLLNAGYRIYSLVRNPENGLKSATPVQNHDGLEIIRGDINQFSDVSKVVSLAKPDYFYHLAAMSHVGNSFKDPAIPVNTNGIGTFNCLEAIRLSEVHTRFIHASSAEIFGDQHSEPCSESSSLNPTNPYGLSKVMGQFSVIAYRNAYKLFACNAILFNHESSRRPEAFVTRKITKGAASIKLGLQNELRLGNLQAQRDWGYAPDYCRGLTLALEAANPDDYVFATGEPHSVAEFCDAAFSRLDLDYKKYVVVDPAFYRPVDSPTLTGDASKARNVLGWKTTKTFREIVAEMVDHDFEILSCSL